jgi:hypothetical protein
MKNASPVKDNLSKDKLYKIFGHWYTYTFNKEGLFYKNKNLFSLKIHFAYGCIRDEISYNEGLNSVIVHFMDESPQKVDYFPPERYSYFLPFILRGQAYLSGTKIIGDTEFVPFERKDVFVKDLFLHDEYEFEDLVSQDRWWKIKLYNQHLVLWDKENAHSEFRYIDSDMSEWGFTNREKYYLLDRGIKENPIDYWVQNLERSQLEELQVKIDESLEASHA